MFPVRLEFGVYSYKPYPVSQVYCGRFSDCQDKASLMIAWLRQVSFEADILVRTPLIESTGFQGM